MYRASFSIHGASLNFVSNSLPIVNAVRQFLSYFECKPLKQSQLEIALYAVHTRQELPRLPGCAGEVLFQHRGKTAGDALREDWQCSLYRVGGQLVADFHQQGRVCIDHARGRAEGHLISPDAMHPDIYTVYFHVALSELLRQAGLYSVHATALAKNGRGVLIPGASGRGKTTCCIALLRAGYRYLSDDHPLIREDPSGIELLCFPEKIDVTCRTIELFPELREARNDLRQGIQKRYFHVDEFYPQAVIDASRPSVIVIPEINAEPRSRLMDLPKAKALEEMLTHGLLVFDKEIAAGQFDTYCRLVDGVDCYRLSFGKDVLELPALIDSVLGA